MKTAQLLCIGLLLISVSSCLTNSQKAEGNYHGQYTNNASIFPNGTCSVTKVNDNTVNVTFSAVGIGDVTVSNVSLTANNDGSVSMVKTGIAEAFSGSVTNNSIDIGYSYWTVAISFTGTK